MAHSIDTKTINDRRQDRGGKADGHSPAPAAFPSPDQIGGLRACDIADRRRRFGINRISPPARPPLWQGWLRQFDDPIIRILLIAAGTTALVGISEGNLVESGVIALIILMATVIGFVSEERAEREFDLLTASRECVPVRVVRDCALASVARSEIVVDDIVWLEAGDEIPADGLLIRGQAVKADERLLTGEKQPALKWPADRLSMAVVGIGTSSPDWLRRGSLITQGRGLMRVTAVGDATELGRAGTAAISGRNESSPLRRQLDGLGRAIAFCGVTMATIVFGVLVAGRLTSGGIPLSWGQGWSHLCIAAGLVCFFLPYWLPAALDLLGLAGFEVTGRGLFPKDGPPVWQIGLRWGAGAAGAGLAFGLVSGILPPALAAWGTHALESALLQDFLQMVALIVVAVPDGLSMSITLCLAWGMRRLLAGRTIVRRLHTCETIGAVTVICTGPTGPLTGTRLSVGRVIIGLSERNIEGPPDALLAEAIAVNATAHLARRHDDPAVTIGDSLEGALLFWLRDRGVSYMAHRGSFELVRQWFAGPENWFMATLGLTSADSDLDKTWRLHVKGPADLILRKCRSFWNGTSPVPFESASAERGNLSERLCTLGAAGRLIGFAMRTGNGACPSDEDPASDLTWLGAILVAGSISPEMASSMDLCRRAGIRVTLMTSEPPEVASKLAREAGIYLAETNDGKMLTGERLRQIGGPHAAHAVDDLAVLAGAGVQDRSSLIDLLRSHGEIVAMVGENDSDAPVLRHADIGLVIGQGASDRIRAAGDLILLDEGLQSLLAAVRWGRSLFLNIQRFLVFQLSVNVMALGINLLGPFIGVRLPLTILQMLWVNIIMDIFAALALATEPPHPGIMDGPPRQSRDFIVTKPMIRAILTTSAVSMAVFVGALRFWQLPGGEIDARRLTWFFCLFVLVQLWNLVNARGFGARRPPWLGISENPWFATMILLSLFAQVAIVQWGGSLFRTVPLSLLEWAALLAGTSPLLLLGRSLGHPARQQASQR